LTELRRNRSRGPPVLNNSIARVGDLEPTETLSIAGTWQIAFLGSVVEEPHLAERRFLSVLTQRRNLWRDYRPC
jgi:hypothetical protein